MEGGNSSDSRQVEYPESARGGRSRPGLEGPACKYSTWRHKTPLSSHVFVLRFLHRARFAGIRSREKAANSLHDQQRANHSLYCGMVKLLATWLLSCFGQAPIHPSIHPIVPWRHSPKPLSIHSFRVSPAPAFLGEPLCPERTGGEDPTFQQWLWEVYRTVRIYGTFLCKQQSVYAVLVEVRRGDIMVVA
jgi:hypothetical protein